MTVPQSTATVYSVTDCGPVHRLTTRTAMTTTLATRPRTRHYPKISEHLIATNKYRFAAACTCGWIDMAKYVRTEHQAMNRWGVHLAARTPCPTAQKKSYPTRSSADTALAEIWRRGRGPMLPARSYHCPCGKWHVTSKAKL